MIILGFYGGYSEFRLQLRYRKCFEVSMLDGNEEEDSSSVGHGCLCLGVRI